MRLAHDSQTHTHTSQTQNEWKALFSHTLVVGAHKWWIRLRISSRWTNRKGDIGRAVGAMATHNTPNAGHSRTLFKMVYHHRASPHSCVLHADQEEHIAHDPHHPCEGACAWERHCVLATVGVCVCASALVCLGMKSMRMGCTSRRVNPTVNSIKRKMLLYFRQKWSQIPKTNFCERTGYRT